MARALTGVGVCLLLLLRMLLLRMHVWATALALVGAAVGVGAAPSRATKEAVVINVKEIGVLHVSSAHGVACQAALA